MKNLILLFVILTSFVFISNYSVAQIPQYTLEVKNGIHYPYYFTFDLVFTHSDSTPLELSGWQFFFLISQDIGTFPSGTGTNSSFVLDTIGGIPVTDLPEQYRPRNPNAVIAGNSPGNYELRIASNALQGCGNGLVVPPGAQILIGRYKVKSTTPLNLSSGCFSFRDSCEVPLSVTRTKINWYDPSDCQNKEMTRCASHSIDFGGFSGCFFPVEIISFSSTLNRNNVTLNWSTASETNNSGFDIERSLVGTNEWTKAGNVTGNGTTNDTKNYSFTERVNTGSYSYRLKQVDFNGNFEYFNLSSEITVGVPDAYKLSQNYPNPFNPSTKIDYDLPYDGKVSILLYDISGREVANLVNEVKTAGYYTATFNGANLASGMYFYRINATGTANNNFVSTKKMMFVK